MPRLVASLGVVVALAVCIGFNTVRYPVVWDMVAVSHQLPQTDQSTKPAEVKPAATTSAASHPGYICTDGVCRLASARETSQPSAPARPAASVVTPATSPKPAATKPAAVDKPAAAKPAADKPAADKPAAAKPETSAPQLAADPQPALGMLVPVARPAASSQAATSRSKATSSAKGGVRRLPALDQMETPAADASQPQAGEQVPIYPTTVTR